MLKSSNWNLKYYQRACHLIEINYLLSEFIG